MLLHDGCSVVCPRPAEDASVVRKRSPHLVVSAAAIAAAAVTILSVKLLRRFLQRNHYSAFMDRYATPPQIPTRTLRSTFESLTLLPPKSAHPNHTHPKSADERNRATQACHAFANSIGRRPYMFQMSTNDQKHGFEGHRSYYWTKDLLARSQNDSVTDEHVLVMIDVDQYIDMHKFLTERINPVILYTFQPETVACAMGEYSFTFGSDNQVTYRVSGDGIYVHHVWNWSVGTVLAVRTFLGVPYRAVAYNVSRQRAGNDHEIVLLSPLMSWGFLTSWLTWFLSADSLDRLKPNHQGFLRLQLQRKDGLYTSTGLPDQHVCATVLSVKDDMFSLMGQRAKGNLPLSTFESNGVGSKAEAAILAAFHDSRHAGVKAIVYPVENAVRNYNFDTSTEVIRPSVVAFASPMIPGECYAPDRSAANSKRGSDKRVTEIATDTGPLHPAELMYVNEFNARIIPVNMRQRGHPVEFTEVYDRQKRNQQRLLLDKGDRASLIRPLTATFPKAECYPKPNDPRIITTMDSRLKLLYGSFIYALSEHVATLPWYAFGKTPLEISRTVAEMCQKADFVIPGDFSRFDGHCTQKCHEAERLFLLCYFDQQYHADLIDMHNKTKNNRSYDPFGYSYETGWARCSGSMDTALFNSYINCLLAYVTFRRMGFQPDAAYERLGIYGGDDSLTPSIDPKKYVQVAKEWGHILESEVIKRHNPGVNFLARIYSPEVWYGNPSSCCDLPRTLTKFHATHQLASTIKPEDKFREKMRGFAMTDAQTPVFREILMWLRRHDWQEFTNYDSDNGIASWWAKFPSSAQFPNDNTSGWMDEYFAQCLPKFDLNILREHLAISHGVLQLLQFPSCVGEIPPPLPASVPYQVNGEIIHPKVVPAFVPSAITNKTRRNQRRARSHRK
jgi:hypothetical protein